MARREVGLQVGSFCVTADDAEMNSSALKQAQHALAAGGEQLLDVVTGRIAVQPELRFLVRILGFTDDPNR